MLRLSILTGGKVTKSVTGTKGGDLQYLDIYKLLLGLTHGSSETAIPLPAMYVLYLAKSNLR